MIVFLRGTRVTLHPTDAQAPDGPDAWWDAGPRAQGHDEILLLARDAATGAERGVIGLTGIDWVERRALLCGGGAARPVDEAAALVLRYAFEELNLDVVEADPVVPEAQRVLRALGFVQERPGGLHRLSRSRSSGTH